MGMVMKLMCDRLLSTRLVGVMNKIANDNSIEMKTALFAFHMFYKLRCNIEEFTDSGVSHKNENVKASQWLMIT